MFETWFGHKQGKNRDIPHSIDLSPFFDTILKNFKYLGKYSLFAMVNQEGKNRDESKYTAIVQKKDGKWYKFGSEGTTEILPE